MRITILSLLFIATTYISLAQTTVNRKIAQRYDEYTSSWEGRDSAVFTYNAFGHEAGRLLLQGQGGNTWDNFIKSTSGYDAIGNLTSRKTEVWTNGAWRNSTLYTYTYNTANKQTEILYQTWNIGNNAWTNTGRILTSYNANQDILKIESFAWTGSWTPTTKQDYLYNGSNVLLTRFSYTYLNGVWKKQEKLDYQFSFGFISNLERSEDDNNGGWYPVSRELSAINGSATPPRISSIREQRRDTANGVWVDSLRTIYSYSANLLTQRIKDSYNQLTMTWTDINRYQYIYNSSNMLAEEIYFVPGVGGLQPDTRKTFAYNSNNLNNLITFYTPTGPATWVETGRESLDYNATDSITYRLLEDYTNSSYVPTKQYFYYYDNVSVGLNDINNLFTSATLYPNPAVDFLNIQTDEKIKGAYQATIYSYEGKKVWSQINSRPSDLLRFDIASLMGGQYILQLTELVSGRSSHFKFRK